MSATFLVTGATGQQGGATVRELLKAGAKVHAFVRDPLKPAAKELEALGAVLFKGDYADVAAIERASAGVKGIFVRVSSFYLTRGLINPIMYLRSIPFQSLATRTVSERRFSGSLTLRAPLVLWTRSSCPLPCGPHTTINGF